MKRIISLVLSLTLLLLIGCASDTADWKQINIEDCGTIKIPSQWDVVVEDDIIYITENEKPIMITTKRSGERESNLYYKDYVYVDFISSAVLSNGVIYGRCKCIYDNKTVEMYYLSLDSGIVFLVWNQEITKDTVVKIAKTFVEEQ